MRSCFIVALGTPLLVLGCGSFGADSPTPDGGSATDAGQTDATAAGPTRCTGTWALCEDFEGTRWLTVWRPQPLRAADSLTVVDDAAQSGNHVLEATTAGLVAQHQASLQTTLQSLGGSLTFSIRLRALSQSTPFDSANFVEVVSLNCGPNTDQRAVGVLFDKRGLTLQLDTNEGEYPGFANDNNWHTLEIRRSPAGSEVTIDGKPQASGKPYTFTGNCTLGVGNTPALGLLTPPARIQLDDIRLK
jgi:hypothetical protein